jgi:PAS domain S-box-containing protein
MEPLRRPPVHVEEDAHRLLAIADAVPALLAYVDADRRYRFNNRRYAEWFGRTPDELRGMRVADVLGAAAYDAVRTEIDTVLAGHPVNYEKLVPYERGSRWTNTQFIPDVGADGTILGFVALVTDVTERKQAEEALRTLQEQLLFADRLASVGTLAMGVAHEINNPLAIVIANQDYVIAALTKLLADYSAQQPTATTEAAMSAFRASITDRLTQMKQAEEALRALQDHFPFSDGLGPVGTLAMGVGHEINNPLAVVIANQDYVIAALTKLLSDCSPQPSPEPGRPEVTELMARIAARLTAMREPLIDAREAADRVRRIVRNLEVFSSPDSTRQERVDVRHVLTASIDMLGDEIRDHGPLVTDYAPVPLVAANAALLGQAFLNLLVNAAQAIHDGNAETNEIRVTARTDPAGNALVIVRDTGCGIAPEHMGRLFDPFFTTRSVGTGTGLGLWVTGRILAQIGGTITVESQPGRGSVFAVTLPACA